MKQNKQYKISRILSYISAGISCSSIIFYFVGLFHADYGKENEFFNLIDMFKYSSLNKEGSKAYLVLSVLLILAIIFSVVAAVISFIRAKGTAIASAILLFAAFVFDLAVLVSVCAAIETEEVNISVGFGSVIALLMTLAAFALELISAVFHCRCGCSEKKHSFAGGVLSNSHENSFRQLCRVSDSYYGRQTRCYWKRSVLLLCNNQQKIFRGQQKAL